MKLTVYIDMLIITNIIINYMLLKITSVLARTAAETKRLVFSAVIGSLFSCMIFADTYFVLSLAVKIISVALSVFIAFGYAGKRQFFRMFFYAFASHLIFSGVMTLLLRSSQIVYMNNLYFYININPFVLIGCIILVYVILSLWDLIDLRNREYHFSIHITIDNITYSTNGYYDTGFNLKDLLTRHPVMLCSEQLFDKNTSPTVQEIHKYFITSDYRDKNIRLVFYSDISGNGMLPAIRPEKVLICWNKKEKELKNILLAVTPQQLPEDGQIIFGKEIFNMIGD